MLLQVSIFCFLFLKVGEFGTNATLSKSKKKKDTCTNDKCKDFDIIVGPSEKSVFTKNLVSTSVKYQDILKHHKAYFDDVYERQFTGDVLGYVTPWNSHGYDIAKKFPKFTTISPVWFQIKQISDGNFQMAGTHDFDEKWLKDVRTINSNVKIVPRMILEGWNSEQFRILFENSNVLYKFVEYVVNFLEERQLDGIVLEIWAQFNGNHKGELSNLIKELGESMMSRRQKLILAVPPPLLRRDAQGMFTKEDFDLLAPIVDGFSLMTYDYPHYGEPGPVSPYDWVKECIKILVPVKNQFRQKILLGINFYGYSYNNRGPTPILGNTYLEILKKFTPKIKWLAESKEHKMEYKDKKARMNVFYPTLQVDALRKFAGSADIHFFVLFINNGMAPFTNISWFVLWNLDRIAESMRSEASEMPEKQKTSMTKIRPEHFLCISTFFSNWGDRMWQFAIGIYLVKITPGSLQLAAIYGLVLSFSAVVFTPMVGDWIDKTPRLKVVRISLLLQNALVMLSALIVLLYFYKVTNNVHLELLLKALIIITGSCADLAGQGEKIAIGKDWVVVVAGGSKDLLAHTNAWIRRIDLSVAVLAPLAVGLLMTLSDEAGIIFICIWNVISMFAEYFLLLKVYNLVPELGEKRLLNNSNEINGDPGSSYTEDNTAIFTEDNAAIPVIKTSNWNVFGRFKTILLGWRVYQRQTVFLAGCALAALFLTVIGFGALTLGYAYNEGLSEFYVSLSLALGSIFGVVATFLFPYIRGKIGLLKTGIVGFFLQWSVLFLCVISIWLPGSPSNLYDGASTGSSALPPTDGNSSNSLLGFTTSVTTFRANGTAGNSTTAAPPVALVTRNFTSIVVLMVGVILSRAGLWISDLTITQIQQENVSEEERGIVGGVQYSFNCILNILRFALTILLPQQNQFGILILISFSAVGCSGIIYTLFFISFTRKTSSKDDGDEGSIQKPSQSGYDEIGEG